MEAPGVEYGFPPYPGVDIDCHTVTRLVEKALSALDQGALDEVKEALLELQGLLR